MYSVHVVGVDEEADEGRQQVPWYKDFFCTCHTSQMACAIHKGGWWLRGREDQSRGMGGLSGSASCRQVVSYRAEPQAVFLWEIDPPQSSDVSTLPALLRDRKCRHTDSMPRPHLPLAVARNNRSSGQGVRGQSRWWWCVFQVQPCAARGGC